MVDQPVIEELYRDLSGELRAYAVGTLGRAEGAEDVVQQAFVNFTIAGASGTRVRDPRAFLYRVVHNLCIDCLRRREVVASEEYLEAGANGNGHAVGNGECNGECDGYRAGAIGDGNGGAMAAHADRTIWLQRAVETVKALPDGQRQAFVLIDLQGRGYDEAAHLLSVSADALRQQVHRARRAIRELGPPAILPSAGISMVRGGEGEGVAESPSEAVDGLLARIWGHIRGPYETLATRAAESLTPILSTVAVGTVCIAQLPAVVSAATGGGLGPGTGADTVLARAASPPSVEQESGAGTVAGEPARRLAEAFTEGEGGGETTPGSVSAAAPARGEQTGGENTRGDSRAIAADSEQAEGESLSGLERAEPPAPPSAINASRAKGAVPGDDDPSRGSAEAESEGGSSASVEYEVEESGASFDQEGVAAVSADPDEARRAPGTTTRFDGDEGSSPTAVRRLDATAGRLLDDFDRTAVAAAKSRARVTAENAWTLTPLLPSLIGVVAQEVSRSGFREWVVRALAVVDVVDPPERFQVGSRQSDEEVAKAVRFWREVWQEWWQSGAETRNVEPAARRSLAAVLDTANEAAQQVSFTAMVAAGFARYEADDGRSGGAEASERAGGSAHHNKGGKKSEKAAGRGESERADAASKDRGEADEEDPDDDW